IPITESQAVPEAPQPPDSPSAAKPESQGMASGMAPPMTMMPPMIPGTSRSTTDRRPAGSPVGSERRTRGTSAPPGIPAQLRGRSALADPAAIGYRPVAMSAAKNGPKEPEALEHEVWEVTNQGT